MPLNDRKLTQEELGHIATDFRQNGTPAFQRHGWELLGHIGALESECCETCALWVPYDNVEASSGECCLPRTMKAVKLWDVSDNENATVSMRTAFDHGCRGYVAKPVRNNEPQCFGG